MKITKPGTRPPEVVYAVRCPACGCEAEATKDELGDGPMCPEPWCETGMEVVMQAVVPPPRTKAEVVAVRENNKGGAGCCNRYADNMPCDCMERAV